MTNLTDKLLAIEVPMEAKCFDIFDKETSPVALLVSWDFNSYPIQLPNAKYNIVGTVSPDGIDFDYSEVIEKVIVRTEVPTRAAGFFDACRFKNYIKENQYKYSLDTPDESFKSLLLSKGLTLDKKYVIIEKL